MKIEYTDKVKLKENPDIPDINKIKADDMNEIKRVVNSNYDEFDKKIMELQYVTLFENTVGTTDDITLNKSINDFNSIEIFGVSSDNAVYYTKINKENYSNIAALYGFSTDGNLYAKIAYLNLVDNQITFRSNRSWYKHQTNGNGGYNANANEIKVTKVIGNYY